MIAGFLLASLLSLSAPAVTRLPPLDQCSSDPSFVAFRDELKGAIARRDREAILAIITDTIEVDFGGGAGREEFARTWGLDNPQTSRLWDELNEILALGCARDEYGVIWAPSMVRQLDEDSDPFTTMVAIEPGAAVHRAANADSPVVARLDWDVVTVGEYAHPEEWVPITLADGRSGYARREHLRWPTDYRAAFERIDGRWRMIVLIAGD